MDFNEDDWIDLYISIQEIAHDVLNDNLHLLSKSEMCKEITNEIFDIFNQYNEQETIIKEEDIMDLIEQIVENELELIDVPKRSLTMTIDTLYDLEPYEIENMSVKIDKLRNVPQPKQKSNEWYEFRHSLISASSLWKIFGTQSQKNSLIYEKCKPFDVSRCEIFSACSSGTLHWGVKYEPVTTMIYEDMYQTNVEEFGCIRHPEYNFIAASPDGININKNNQKYGRMLEIKNIVNREITGIPKNEYWIQTQIQMETCDLSFCDFVETRIKEFSNEEEFYNKDSCEYKGVILHFIERPNINDFDLSHIKPTGPTYQYKPLNIPNEKDHIEKWSQEVKAEMDKKNLAWFNTIYWYLDEYSCVTIPRNKIWFENSIKQIEEFWNTIQYEKENGYEHRAAKKRSPDVIVNKNDNTYKTNIKNTGGFCLIRLDENGNAV